MIKQFTSWKSLVKFLVKHTELKMGDNVKILNVLIPTIVVGRRFPS